MKNNHNIVRCGNNTHQGAQRTDKQTSACAWDLGDVVMIFNLMHTRSEQTELRCLRDVGITSDRGYYRKIVVITTTQYGSGVLRSVCLYVCLLSVSQSVSVCVCLSASISLEPLDRSSQNFVCKSPVAVARSSYGGVAICYVLQVLWMTPRLAVVGRMAMRCDTGGSLMSMDALFTDYYCSLFSYF